MAQTISNNTKIIVAYHDGRIDTTFGEVMERLLNEPNAFKEELKNELIEKGVALRGWNQYILVTSKYLHGLKETV